MTRLHLELKCIDNPYAVRLGPRDTHGESFSKNMLTTIVHGDRGRVPLFTCMPEMLDDFIGTLISFDHDNIVGKYLDNENKSFRVVSTNGSYVNTLINRLSDYAPNLSHKRRQQKKDFGNPIDVIISDPVALKGISEILKTFLPYLELSDLERFDKPVKFKEFAESIINSIDQTSKIRIQKIRVLWPKSNVRFIKRGIYVKMPNIYSSACAKTLDGTIINGLTVVNNDKRMCLLHRNGNTFCGEDGTGVVNSFNKEGICPHCLEKMHEEYLNVDFGRWDTNRNFNYVS